MMLANSLVFLIDDDASVRKGVLRLLRSAGYKSESRVVLPGAVECTAAAE
jgi:FixJ family two-component response regulator